MDLSKLREALVGKRLWYAGFDPVRQEATSIRKVFAFGGVEELGDGSGALCLKNTKGRVCVSCSRAFVERLASDGAVRMDDICKVVWVM